MPCVQLILADLRHLAWMATRAPMVCHVSKIDHYCERPVTLETWSKLWVVSYQNLTRVPHYGMFTYETACKNVCWQPNAWLFSSFHKKDYTAEMKMPPRLTSVWHYSIPVPKDEHGLTYEFIRMHRPEGIVLYGYYTLTWGTPRLGWKEAPRWPAVAMALECPDGFERVYDCKAEDVAKLVVRKGDEMYDLMLKICRIG